MADDLLSDADMGLGTAPSQVAPGTAGPSASPVSDGDAPALTIRPSAPAPVLPPAAPVVTAPSDVPALLSDEDMGITAPSAPGLAPSPGNGGILSNSPDDGWLSGAAKGTATGVIRGLSNAMAPADTAGSMADLLMATAESRFTNKTLAETLADMKQQRAQQQSADMPSNDQGVLGKIGSGLHWLAGASDPRNLLPSGDWAANKAASVLGQYDPTSEVGRLAQAGVQLAAGSAGPGVGAKAGTWGDIARGVVDMAPANFATGAAAQGATDATDSPSLGLAAGLAAPFLLHSAARVGQKLPGPANAYFQNVNDARIGKQLYGLADNPTAVRDTVAPTDLSSSPSSIAVPGFKPTTGQLTGDLGLLKAENALQAADNKPFAQRSGEQNAAAQGALRGIAAGGDEMRPSAVLQSQLDTVDQATRQAQDRITAGAQQLAAGMGPGETADSLGSTIQSRVEAARQQAQGVKANLYKAVDPDGTLGTTSAPVAGAVKKIRSSFNSYDTPLSDDEKQLYGLAQQMPPQISYQSMVAFDRNLNGKIATAEGGSKARLQQLKSAVMGVLDGTVDGQAQTEAKQVAAGTRDPSDTIASRLQHVAPLGASAPPAGSSVFTPSGRQIGVRYGVVDAHDLTVSHRPDMTPNPDYPANLQPRDRTRAASDAQVADIASRLQPERLGPSASAAEGAPIVGPDGIVESGNGRVLAIQRAHTAGGPQAQAYRDFLATHGFDASGMSAPVMVRHRVTDLSPAERVRFAQEANASPVLAPSASERAATDAGRLSDAALGRYQGGDIGSAENRPFVQSFLKDVADKGEAGQFATADGSLSLDGRHRVQNALVHAGYGDSKLVASLAETGDPDIAAFGNVMSDQAGRMAQLRNGIAAGAVHPGADISAPVLEAGRVVQRARAGNLRLADAVAQQDAFNPISAEAHHVLQAAYGPALSARLNRTKMGTFLNAALDEAAQQSTEARLFGEQPLTAGQILRSAQARHAGFDTAPSDQVSRVARDPGAGHGESGQGALGPRDGSRGASGAGPGAQGSVVQGPAAPLQADAAAGARLRAAKDANIDYQTRFVDGPVARAIAKNHGRFDASPASVPAMAIVKGDKGYETAKAFLRDSNNDPAVLEALTDRALSPLRASLTSDSTVNPAAYARWKRDYAPALRALDEADPGFASRYDNAARATDLMTQAGVVREQAMKALQDKTTTKLIGATDPSEVHDIVGRIIQSKQGDAVTRMRALVGKLKGDPDALAGLRRAGAAHLAERFSNAAKEAATGEQTISTKLPKEIADKRAVLSELFDKPEVDRINAIAHVMDQKQRSADALKNKGTSQTSRDLGPLIKKATEKAGHGHGATTLLALAGDRAAESVWNEGAEALPKIALGAGGAAALWALNRLRTGNAHADQAAIADALMNPERFAHYTARVSPAEAERKGATLSAMVRRSLITMPVARRAASQAQETPGYARGGGIGAMVGQRSQTDIERAADGLVSKSDHFQAQMKINSALVASRAAMDAAAP